MPTDHSSFIEPKVVVVCGGLTATRTTQYHILHRNMQGRDAQQLEITKTSAVDLVTQMGTGSLAAVETVTAFLKRAHIGQQLLNFATEFMVEEVLGRAAELDAHFKSTGKLVGPLHGVPISVKEHVGLKGRICHSAYVAWTSNIPTEDALLVRLAKRAGAVFHVRTNQPQSLMVVLLSFLSSQIFTNASSSILTAPVS